MKTFRSIWGLAIALFVLNMSATSCSSGNTSVTTGDVSYVDADLQPKPFNVIDVETVADVYYTQNNGDEHHVRIDYSAIKDEKVLQQLKEKLKVVYREGKVVIGIKGKIVGKSSLKHSLKIYITSPDLVKITQEGVGNFYSDYINSDKLEIDNEGVGSVEIKKVLANKLDIDNEGVGSINIGRFEGDRLVIDNEGVGKVKADVDCQSVAATLEGVGSITLTGVTRHLQKNKDGVGSIHVKDLKIAK